MSKYASQALHALAVYLERGRKALECISINDLDEAERLLRLRNAAFQNFRALDDLALKDGVDLSQDPSVPALLAEVASLHGPLDQALQDVFEKTGRQLAKIREARQTLSSYRSKTARAAGFESSV
jgi:hypothetical protein